LFFAFWPVKIAMIAAAPAQTPSGGHNSPTPQAAE